MEEQKKKKKKIWIALGIVVTTAAVVGGSVVAYKKCPKFKGMVKSAIKYLKTDTDVATPKKELHNLRTKPYYHKNRR